MRESRSAPSLVAALEALGPPLRDRRAERSAVEESWARSHAPLEALAREQELFQKIAVTREAADGMKRIQDRFDAGESIRDVYDA